jgi:hypothetical protein
VVCTDKAEQCCKADQGVSKQAGQSSDCGKCPVDHHHHGGCSCSFVLPMVVADKLASQFDSQSSFLLGIRHENEVAPDGPFLGSEKPPLI